MKRVLVFEPSWRRVEAAASEASPYVELLLMDAEGRITFNGHEVSVDDAQPQAGWASIDVFSSPAARHYMIALLKSERLEWLQSSAAGFDHPIFGQMVEKGVTLTTSHGQAVGMADYVIAGVLDHFQHGPERRAAQAAGDWKRIDFREVMGTTWLILGFGAIGQGVAQRARGFGAHTLGVRRDRTPHPYADELFSPDLVQELLPRADVVVLSLPLSPATHHMADAEFFAAMKDRSVFVNVGRGGLVDEPALLAALDAGKPEHAVLDVFETEPLPAESPFWGHPRVSLTPHASGASNGSSARNDALFADNLVRFVKDDPLLNTARPGDVLAGKA
jgi:phosphoglycerate dehydrogenase-like enzyme